MFVVIGITFYYTVILARCLDYIWYSITLKWGTNPADFFYHQHLHLSNSFWHLGSPSTIIFVALIVIWILNWVIELKGIQRGIELALYNLYPLVGCFDNNFGYSRNYPPGIRKRAYMVSEAEFL